MSKTPAFQKGTYYLELSYLEGNVTRLQHAHSTGWRQLPFHLCGQLTEGTTRGDFDDGTVIDYHCGMGFFVPAGVRHMISKTSGGDVISRWAHFTVNASACYDPLAALQMPYRFTGLVADAIGRLCTQLSEPKQSQQTTLSEQAHRQQLRYSLLAELASLGVAAPEHPSQPELARLQPLLTVLHANPAISIDIEAMAEISSLSPSRFHAVFKACLQRTPLQYLREVRLLQARRLLLTTDTPIEQVALQVGYTDPFHFSRIFKTDTGLSPQHFREEMRRRMW